jgi:hypothetical protein
MDEVFCMNCQEFEKLTFALARQRLYDDAVHQQSLIHAEACARCADGLLEARILVEGVRTVAAEINREAAPAHVEAALLDAFRNRQAVPVRVLPVKRTRVAHWKPVALAAGVLILFSLVVFSWQQAREVGQKPKSLAAAPPPAIVAEPATAVPSELRKCTAPAAQANRPRRRAVHQPDAAVGKTERVTEFFSLMEGEEFEAPESGQIVRIELSGAALLEVGLPVDVAMTNAPIKADVVLGEDGMARAIRFVRQ